MKKYLLLLVAIVVSFNIADAQEYKKALKEAKKNFAQYNLNPSENAEKLAKAMASIDQAFSTEEAMNSSKAWLTKGEIFTEMATADINASLIGGENKLNQPDAAVTAFEAYQKSYELSKKKKDKKKALKGIQALENNLYNTAIIQYQAQDYAAAFGNFKSADVASTLLGENDMDSRLDDEQLRRDHLFSTAVSGYYGEQYDETLPYLDMLSAKDSADAFVFDAMYNIYTKKGDTDNALAALTKGRKMYPEDSGLLFSEINHYLASNQLDVLLTKLDEAVALEPENMSVVLTQGNVYEQLGQKLTKDGDVAKGTEYQAKAKGIYENVLANEPDNFDANYSVGAFYYNEAASMTDQINALSNDFSKAGLKKYEDLKAQMDGKFKKALPYFLKAESVNTTDVNTLIALKEIYARSNDFEKSGEYKAKLEAAQAEK